MREQSSLKLKALCVMGIGIELVKVSCPLTHCSATPLGMLVYIVGISTFPVVDALQVEEEVDEHAGAESASGMQAHAPAACKRWAYLPPACTALLQLAVTRGAHALMDCGAHLASVSNRWAHTALSCVAHD